MRRVAHLSVLSGIEEAEAQKTQDGGWRARRYPLDDAGDDGDDGNEPVMSPLQLLPKYLMHHQRSAATAVSQAHTLFRRATRSRTRAAAAPVSAARNAPVLVVE